MRGQSYLDGPAARRRSGTNTASNLPATLQRKLLALIWDSIPATAHLVSSVLKLRIV